MTTKTATPGTEEGIDLALRADFETLFFTIHASDWPAARLFERLSDDRRYCSMEVEYAWQTYRALARRAAPDSAQAAVEEVRNQALEEAAKLCEEEAANPSTISCHAGFAAVKQDSAHFCASRIRALRTTSTNGGAA
jgi:hypothetical protein